MKRTEETLRRLIKDTVNSESRKMRKELACRVLEEVCKKALVNAGAESVQIYDLQVGMLQPELKPRAKEHLAGAAETKTRAQIKIGPDTKLREPFLQDIKDIIDQEMHVPYLKR